PPPAAPRNPPPAPRQEPPRQVRPDQQHGFAPNREERRHA
ncbi:translation initiation factor 2, partial [Burkholderia thailandensis]